MVYTYLYTYIYIWYYMIHRISSDLPTSTSSNGGVWDSDGCSSWFSQRPEPINGVTICFFFMTRPGMVFLAFSKTLIFSERSVLKKCFWKITICTICSSYKYYNRSEHKGYTHAKGMLYHLDWEYDDDPLVPLGGRFFFRHSHLSSSPHGDVKCLVPEKLGTTQNPAVDSFCFTKKKMLS